MFIFRFGCYWSLALSCPRAFFIVRAARQRRYFHKLLWARQKQHKQLLFGNRHPWVLSGPFAGLRYLDETVWGPIEPKWLGTYEQELNPIIHQIICTPYSTIIDVGSAEGYYGVGLAKKHPDAILYSYDIDVWARKQQRKLAHLNDVTNIQIGAVCTAKELGSRISGRCLLLCDIEGYEYGLLDPVAAPALRQCDILVEVHEFEHARLSIKTGKEELRRRFSTSHEITIITLQHRCVPNLEADVLERLGPKGLADCMDEMRNPGQLWMWLEARNSGDT
jgi:hypothetical protein